MRAPRIRNILPSRTNIVLATLSSGLLIASFPDLDLSFLAWFALVPLIWAVERQKHCVAACFIVGWIFGTIFFFGTCWWLTFAPITYAGFPWPVAYFLLFIVTAITGLFPAIFTGILAVLLRRFGSRAFLAAPFVWVFTEFLRYWLTGNNWNAIGYSQAFATNNWLGITAVQLAFIGGVWLSSGYVVVVNGVLGIIFSYLPRLSRPVQYRKPLMRLPALIPGAVFVVIVIPSIVGLLGLVRFGEPSSKSKPTVVGKVVAVQPNVPMAGLDYRGLERLRQRQIDLAETALSQMPATDRELPTTVVLPESPMNFMYADDREFQQFIGDFARRNNVSVLFNSAEPDKTNGKYFNSAVMVSPEGREVAQYDKIYLLPFGEAVPQLFDGILPGFVGNFSYGGEYDILPLGEAKAGVMICFESHFGQLSRQYVLNGADVLIEMTNDGYLGPTPVLRQHLANAVFRAVETHRPVLRITNVGITAYINEAGAVVDPAPVYAEATRIWRVAGSDGSQTFYVRYGDWFAWLCTLVTVGLVILSYWKSRGGDSSAEARTQ